MNTEELNRLRFRLIEIENEKNEINERISEILKENKENDIKTTLKNYDNGIKFTNPFRHLNNAYKVFLIKLYGSKYKDYLGKRTNEFMTFYYPDFNKVVSNIKRPKDKVEKKFSYDEDEREDEGDDGRKCFLCKYTIPEGGSGSYYELLEYEFCNKSCVKEFSRQLHQKGILILGQYLGRYAYDD